MPYYLTIDNGGTNTKVTIFDTVGTQLAEASFPTKRQESQRGFQELDVRDLLTDLGSIIKQMLEKSGLSSNQIAAVTVVGHGKGLYVLNHNREIFHNGILSTDERAQDLAHKFEQQVDAIYPISQQHVMCSQAPVLLAWIKQNQPQIYEQIGVVLSNKDFIRYLLTDELYQEITDASGNNLVNLQTGAYDERLCEFFGIPEMFDKLPPLVKSTDQCGAISANAAKKTGLQEGIPVYAGMFDIDACTIATGVLDDSLISMIVGTWNMNLFPSPQAAPEKLGIMNSIFVTGEKLVEASSPTSAGNLELIIKILFSDEVQNAKNHGKSIYDYLENFLQVTNATFNKLLFFPFLYGSNVDAHAQGAFIGIKSTTTKSEMIRAVYEGVCFAHYFHIEQLLKVATKSPQAVRISGGAVNSPSWVQMFADVLQMPIEVTEATELGGLGGAMACAVGQGEVSSWQHAVDKMTHIKTRYEPNTEAGEMYQAKYAVYKEFLQQLDGTWHNLSSMQQRLEATHDDN